MDIPILDIAGYVIYAAMALAALYGVFVTILLTRRVGQKQFRSTAQAEDFLTEIEDHLKQKEYEAIIEKCDRPPFWSKAVPQLIMVAIDNRHQKLTRLRRTLAERFERDVLADLDYRASWISTIVKSAPMLGLLGTVVGMINAFAKIAAMQQSGKTDPSVLAQDISFALSTTAIGLAIAIPLVLAGNMLQVRIGKLQDSVQEQLGRFLDVLVDTSDEELV
ncbi:MotA/TolQ/ExbB proton channel family protein [Calycomorphotria hydatis]|uniref:Biopolymer transport protein ExbB n=1 Tax=Calycomorphotria hydatis TaxID=2528027 RepID=A0A517T7W4_9PLAN|nr:MotA/TolQ/ExbB proton channel family protein [Calycomorphotria hydatis]QDT64457.1 Biopolymer transport protein ExbB [Calycomorphotria hydatis]